MNSFLAFTLTALAVRVSSPFGALDPLGKLDKSYLQTHPYGLKALPKSVDSMLDAAAELREGCFQMVRQQQLAFWAYSQALACQSPYTFPMGEIYKLAGTALLRATCPWLTPRNQPSPTPS